MNWFPDEQSSDDINLDVDTGHAIENGLYFELLRRICNVAVGKESPTYEYFIMGDKLSDC